MGALTGLPDFGAAVGTGSTQAFGAVGGNSWLVMPQGGALTAFQLTMTRVAGAPSASGSYAMLDLEVGCEYALDGALALARAIAPDATVAALPIGLGYARLISAGAGLTLPDSVTEPVMLGWSSSDGARWSQHLDVDSAEVIKGGVLKGALLFGVRIEFVIQGVAARASAVVNFVPAMLGPQVLSSGQTLITREDLISRLSNSSRTPALQTTATRIDIAEAVADRLLACFARFTPAPNALELPCFAFGPMSQTERLDWDLAESAPGMRGFVIRLDTVSGLSRLDPQRLVQETTIPPLDLGFRQVTLAANLPAPRVGAPAIGARLSAPPAPPNRPNGINQTVTFDPPDDLARITLRFDPSEPFAYTLTPFAVLEAGALVREIDAPVSHSTDAFVQLQAQDFGLAITHVTASARLIAAAVVDGTLKYLHGGKTGTLVFKLAGETTDVGLATPIDATDVQLSLSATAAEGTVLKRAAAGPGRISLDFPAFAEYGPQTVVIHCTFTGDEPPLILELQAEEGGEATSLAFAPSAPDNSWTYFALTPFRARYRFRPHGGSWSPLRAPGVPLEIDAQGAALDGRSDPPSSFEMDGVEITADIAQPGILRYLPAVPTPELDTSGNPTLFVLKTGATANLQFGVRLDLPPGGNKALAAAIAHVRPDLANAELQPRLVTVQAITVKLTDETGEAAVIASGTGSSFPPYGAVFSIPLDGAQASQVISAVGGRTGVLTVEYALSAPGSSGPVARTADIAAWFAGTSGLSHVRVFAETS
jgi:hypothetical protein